MPSSFDVSRYDIKRFFAVILVIVLAGCSSQAQTPTPVRPAIVARPVSATTQYPAFFSGEVRARHESQLGFRVDGKIERRLVDVGARVEAGQVLAILDPADLRLDLAASEAAIASAQANVALAQTERDRFAALLQRKLISASQFQTQETALTSTEARLKQARAQHEVSRNRVGYTELRADRAGTVTSISAESGQVVAAGQVIAVLAQNGEREIEIALPEAEVSLYPVGTRATISLWSMPDRRYEGTVREVSPDADNASRTYRTRVSVAYADDAVQLGMTARVRFDDKDCDTALSVPLTALHARDQEPAVWVVDPENSQVSLRAIEIAAYRENAVELTAGVTPDDFLVVAGVHKLHEGQTIRPIDRDNQPVALR